MEEQDRVRQAGLIGGRVHTCDKFRKGIREISFHFRAVYQKYIEFTGNFLIQMREILKCW